MAARILRMRIPSMRRMVMHVRRGTLRYLPVALGLVANLSDQEPKLGTFEIQFEQTHPLAGFAEITKRMGWKKGEMKKHDPKLGYVI